MSSVKIVIDFSTLADTVSMHNKLKELFGFPDFYGKNIHSLIDCLTSLRYPEDGMTKINIDKNSFILLEVANITYTKKHDEMMRTLFSSVQYVNYRCKIMGDEPSILLILSQSDG